MNYLEIIHSSMSYGLTALLAPFERKIPHRKAIAHCRFWTENP